MLSVFLPLGIHSNEEHLLKHLEVPRSTSCMGMSMAEASMDITGVGEAGASAPGGISLRASVTCRSPPKIMQRFTVLRSIFTRSCYKRASSPYNPF